MIGREQVGSIGDMAVGFKIGTSIRFTLKNHGSISTKDAIVKNILDEGNTRSGYSRVPNNTVGNLIPFWIFFPFLFRTSRLLTFYYFFSFFDN